MHFFRDLKLLRRLAPALAFLALFASVPPLYGPAPSFGLGFLGFPRFWQPAENSASLLNNAYRRPLTSFPSKLIGGVSAFISEEYGRSLEESRKIVLAAYRESEVTGIPLSLLLAIVAKESSFDPHQANSYGAIGLMQVVPRFHPKLVKGLSRSDLKIPSVNLWVGSHILQEYLKSEGGDMRAALYRYSGGSSAYSQSVVALRHAWEARLRPFKAAQALASAQEPVSPRTSLVSSPRLCPLVRRSWAG